MDTGVHRAGGPCDGCISLWETSHFCWGGNRTTRFSDGMCAAKRVPFYLQGRPGGGMRHGPQQFRDVTWNRPGANGLLRGNLGEPPTPRGRSLGEKKSVPKLQFCKNTACHMFNHGWWQLAVGGWRLVAVGGSWRRLVVGDWRLVGVGGWRQLAVDGWRLVRPEGRSFEKKKKGSLRTPLPPLCDIPSGCCSFTGPWTVARSSLRMLRRVAAFCRPLRPVLPLVSFPRSRSPAVGVLGLCWMWQWCAVCASAAPNSWRIEDVLVVARVV